MQQGFHTPLLVSRTYFWHLLYNNYVCMHVWQQAIDLKYQCCQSYSIPIIIATKYELLFTITIRVSRCDILIRWQWVTVS